MCWPVRSRRATLRRGRPEWPAPPQSHTMAGTVKPQSRRDDPPSRHDLHLAELLDFRPDQGIIRLHEQRVVILSAAAMGLMRKELVDTLGLETARRVLLRFGFADGYHDAVNLRAARIGPARWTASVPARCSTRWKALFAPKFGASITTTRPGDSRRRCAGTTRTRRSSTSITTARARRRCAGRWWDTPAGSSARVSERKSTFARSAARDRESATAPRSGGMWRAGGRSANPSAPTFRRLLLATRSSGCAMPSASASRNWTAASGCSSAVNASSTCCGNA